MFDLERLDFETVREAYPERFEKVNLAAAQIVDGDSAQFVVKRPESDEAHVCELVESLSHMWGYCGCEGWQYNDGPCSHLCSVWRAEKTGLVEIPKARASAISVEVHNEQQQLADHAAEPENRPVADGGERL